MNKKKDATGSTNENLLPLLHIAREMLALSIEDTTARMLALDMSTTLSANMAADKTDIGRRMIRMVMRDDRIHVMFGMQHIEKYSVADENGCNHIAAIGYAYLKDGESVLKENIASYQE